MFYKKCFILFYLFFVFISMLQAQIRVDYTNRLLVAETSLGEYYVFIYSNNITFVKRKGGNIDKVTTTYSTLIEDAFIAGNYFVYKARRNHYFINLADVNSQAEGKELVRLARPGSEIRNIDSVYIYLDNIYYTKYDDSRLYQYNTGNQTETALFNTQTSTKKQIAFFPLKDRRNTEYSEEKRVVDEIVSYYKSFTIDKNRLGEELLKIPQNQRDNSDRFYASNKSYISSVDKYSGHNYSNFLVLASLTEKTSEADRVIKDIDINVPSITQQQINSLYINDTRWNELRNPNELSRRQSRFSSIITAQKDKLQREWNLRTDIDYETRARAFEAYDEKKSDDWSWQNNNQERNFDSYVSLIRKLHSDMSLLLKDSKFIVNNNEYKQYSILWEVFDWMAMHYSEDRGTIRNFDSNRNILNMINIYAKNAYDRQIRILITARDDFNLTYKTLKDATTEFNGVKQQLDREINTALTEKTNALNMLTEFLINKYRNNISIDINNVFRQVRGDSLGDRTDYCIISENDKWIGGNRFIERVSFRDFDFNTLQLQQNSLNSLLSPIRDGIFIVLDNSIFAYYDLSKQNIIKKSILKDNIPEGIKYFITNSYNGNSTSQFQYIVTKDGKLLRLSIRNDRINREQIGTVSESDYIIVIQDTAYIFSEDGRVNANNRSMNEIRLRSNNVIRLENRQFVIR